MARLTGQGKKDQPVHDQHGPEDRQVEDLKPTAHKADDHCPCRRMPKLELRQSPDERSELLVLLRG